MRILLYKKVFFALFAMFSCAIAFNQQLPDSLSQYLEIAVKNNPVVLQKFNEYQSSVQKAIQVGSLNDPELSIGVFLSPMEILAGNQVADIRLMQMFPWFGVLKYSKDEMSLMAKASYESFLDAKFQVYFDVQSAWYELYKIKEDISISEENLELLKNIEKISLAKFRVSQPAGSNSSSGGGIGTTSLTQNYSSPAAMQTMGSNQAAIPGTSPTAMQNNSMGGSAGSPGLADLYKIQIEIGDLENSIALLKNQQSTIHAKFNSYLDRPALAFVSLPERLNADTLGISLFAISDSIQKNNPMLEMLKYEQQSLEARKNMVNRMSYPMIGLGVNYSVINKNEMSTSAMNGKDMIMPMVTVSLPIYRKKYKAMQTETDFMKEARNQGYHAISNSLQTEYYEAIQLFEDAQRRKNLYESQSRLAQNSLNIMIKDFSVSGSELPEILRICQLTLDYKFNTVAAVTDYNTAIARLNRLMAKTQMQ